MPKTTPPPFKFHVDGSCLTDSTDLQMAHVERSVSDQTVVHHDSWSEEVPPKMQDRTVDKEAVESAEGLGEEVGECNKTEQDSEDIPSEDEKKQHARERQIDRIEAQIQAAARAVVASIEEDHYNGHEDSVLSTQTDESYDQEGSQVTYDEVNERAYGDGTELTYDGTETSYEPHSDNEDEAAGDSSSHHDGDIDDDVFSRESGHSQRSSLNSIHDLTDETKGKELTSPTVGEEAYKSSPMPEEEDTISRIPSSGSYVPRDATPAIPATPSRVLSRPPFRTPSSVRAMQMTSPTPSLFSSPRSSKRHLPPGSRSGTPTSQYSPSKRTPTRFKAKKELPLVLLHVTVLPLEWTYSHVISSYELPVSLQRVKDNWRLLQEKLGDMVLERGILLSHPQDSFDVLEERLLEALELPVRPRSRILKCGHYMGPETPSSDEEGVDYYEAGTKLDGNRKWCDICGRDVRFEGVDLAGRNGEQRFRVKIYASNGLMSAGAWGACWREMESVDVEIEPFVEGHLVSELEAFAAVAMVPKSEAHEESDGFVDEEAHETEAVHEIEKEEARKARFRAQEEEMARALIEEEEIQQKAQFEEDLRRKAQDEERMREIYGQPEPPRQDSRSRSSRRVSRPALDDDSLTDLLFKALKVAMKDTKIVVICVLSILVLLLAVNSFGSAPPYPQVISGDALRAHDVAMDAELERMRQRAVVEAPDIAEQVGIIHEVGQAKIEGASMEQSTVEVPPPLIKDTSVTEKELETPQSRSTVPCYLPLEQAIIDSYENQEEAV